MGKRAEGRPQEIWRGRVEVERSRQGRMEAECSRIMLLLARRVTMMISLHFSILTFYEVSAKSWV